MEGTLKLSYVARFRIMQILTERSPGKGSETQYEIGADLFDKIFISDELQESLADPVTRQLSAAKIRALPDLEITLNHNEMSKLETILKDYEKLLPADRTLWWRGVMKQIADSSKPQLEDAAVREKRLEDRQVANIQSKKR